MRSSIFLEKISRILCSFLGFYLYLCILEGCGFRVEPVRPLRRLFPVPAPLYIFIIFLVPIRLSVCALRSGRTERRMTAGFFTFQLAAVCALRSGRTERRMTAGFFTFQLAALCALRSGRTERRMTAGFFTFQLAAVCALRSGRTERRMTAGFFTFQLAALCALRSGRTERRMTAGFKGVS